MRKIIDNKYYIEAGDILFLASNITCSIPKSIWDKIFFNEDLLDNLDKYDNNDKEDYIELTTKEEITFFNSLNYICLYNDICDLSLEELNNLYVSLKVDYQERKREYDNCIDVHLAERRKELDVELQIIQLKMTSLNNFINNKIKSSRSENGDISRTNQKK